MTEKNNKKVMYSIIGIAILLISLVGVTYSFFNYTRTGTSKNSNFGARGVVTLKPGTKLENGTGTYDNPYIVGPLVTRTN